MIILHYVFDPVFTHKINDHEHRIGHFFKMRNLDLYNHGFLHKEDDVGVWYE